jgi:hypothetical protein
MCVCVRWKGIARASERGCETEWAIEARQQRHRRHTDDETNARCGPAVPNKNDCGAFHEKDRPNAAVLLDDVLSAFTGGQESGAALDLLRRVPRRNDLAARQAHRGALELARRRIRAQLLQNSGVVLRQWHKTVPQRCAAHRAHTVAARACGGDEPGVAEQRFEGRGGFSCGDEAAR